MWGGGILLGTILVLSSLIAIYTGSGSGGGLSKPIRRDEHPVQFWAGVSLSILMGILFIIYSFTHPAPYARR